MNLVLKENIDVLKNISKNKNRPKLVIGFSAETKNLISFSKNKLFNKGCDWIIANQVGGDDDPIFGSITNKVLMITELGVETWPQMLKTELAEKLADQIEAEFSK